MTGHTRWAWNTSIIPGQAPATPDIYCADVMSSSEIVALRTLLPPLRSTLGTRSPAHHIAESRHTTDITAIPPCAYAPRTRVRQSGRTATGLPRPCDSSGKVRVGQATASRPDGVVRSAPRVALSLGLLPAPAPHRQAAPQRHPFQGLCWLKQIGFRTRQRNFAQDEGCFTQVGCKISSRARSNRVWRCIDEASKVHRQWRNSWNFPTLAPSGSGRGRP